MKASSPVPSTERSLGEVGARSEAHGLLPIEMMNLDRAEQARMRGDVAPAPVALPSAGEAGLNNRFFNNHVLGVPKEAAVEAALNPGIRFDRRAELLGRQSTVAAPAPSAVTSFDQAEAQRYTPDTSARSRSGSSGQAPTITADEAVARTVAERVTGQPSTMSAGDGRIPSVTQASPRNATSNFVSAPNVNAAPEMSGTQPVRSNLPSAWDQPIGANDFGLTGQVDVPTSGPAADWEATVPQRPATAGPDMSKALPYGLSQSEPQGPRMSERPYQRSFKERAETAKNKMLGYARSPRYQRGRRVAYGVGALGAGAVGLDALIGGERERRQEQEMY